MNDNPIIPAPPAVLDGYDFALMGLSIHPTQGPRFAYSINALAKKESIRYNVSIDRARERVWEMVVDIVNTHGDAAPLFIDDAAFEPDVTQKKRIISV